MSETSTANAYGLVGIERMSLDTRGQFCEIHLTSGEVVKHSLLFPRNANTNVLRTSFSFSENLLTLKLTRGEDVTIELELPGSASDARGRPIVYLDQCHWSTLANQLYEPGRVPERDRESAARLIELARDSRIILPLSSAHMGETSALYNVRRQNLAAAMLEFSHGWQMRNPIAVRQNEIFESLCRRFNTGNFSRPAVLTLEPNVIYANHLHGRQSAYIPPSEFPPAIRHLLASIVSAASTYDMLLDPERIESNKPTKWVEVHRRIMKDFKDERYSPTRRRELALGFALIDASEDVAFAVMMLGLSQDQLKRWATAHFTEDLERMPFFGLFADVTELRLSALNTRWENNDFYDMLFLSCAAAYSDIVAAETGATNYIRRSWRQRPGIPPIVNTLGELVERLEPLLGPPV